MTESGRIKQVGTIPLVIEKGRIMAVMVTARNSEKTWIFPKGHREKGVADEKMSLLEAYEEAGVTGHVFPKSCGKFKYSKMGRNYTIKFFPMLVKNVLTKWPEKNQRKRIIIPVNDALGMIQSDKIIKLLKRSAKKIRSKT